MCEKEIKSLCQTWNMKHLFQGLKGGVKDYRPNYLIRLDNSLLANQDLNVIWLKFRFCARLTRGESQE